MTGFVKREQKYYTGVEPSTTLVYYNRPGQTNEGGAWEEIAFNPRDDGTFDAVYVAAQLQLSIQPDGSFQTRPLGEVHGYETFQIRTEQGTDRHVLYRTDLAGGVYLVEVK